MSVQGTNPPDLKSVSLSTLFGRSRFFDFFWPRDEDVASKDIVSVQAPSVGALPDAQVASGISSYWIDGLPAPARQSMRRSVNLASKRLLDIVVASLALVFLLPLMLAVAAAIKISDPGPALFRQDRVGKDGRLFSIFKFRSMYIDKCSHDGVDQTVAQDPRIMPLGAFIRRTSIDELPQLLNVLFGDMSLVGPRPHVEGQLAAGKRYSDVVPYYDYRSAMRPGLTGWAQANGYRGPTDNLVRASQRIEHDVAYIQNFSLALDIHIILKTLHREFIGGTGF